MINCHAKQPQHIVVPTLNSEAGLLLNENRLVAIGKHESLLETNDYYRSLVTHQQNGVK